MDTWPHLILRGLAGWPFALLALVVAACPLEAQAAFTNNGDGTVTDTRTGLTWDRCTFGLTGSECADGGDDTYDWPEASAVAELANSERYLNYSDWRLPTLGELQSLVEPGHPVPAINASAFPRTLPTQWYWSSSPVADGAAEVWAVYFSDGRVGKLRAGLPGHIRLVRDGLPRSRTSAALRRPGG